ncbi:hypothetical protein DEJ50_21835 [Streptomyces venezuelae]|uniref:Ig-like domain-containing protein n=2 Tax=Streptomyces venezuelae TaxID=54571 RepID=A0A5P2D5S2_STRVZ|nr:hypothetical protein DEJ50_21835 [Streptomyces venezuelae]
MRAAVMMPVVAGLALAYAPGAAADENVSITSVEAVGELIPGKAAKINVVVMNHKAPTAQRSCVSVGGEAFGDGGLTSCFDLGPPGTSVTHVSTPFVGKTAKPGPTTLNVSLQPRTIQGIGKDTKTAPATVGAAPPACNPLEINKEAFRVGHEEGLKDGREDGFADSYRQSYDDAFKTKKGLTAEQCTELIIAAHRDGYGKGYEAGFKEGQAKGGKVGEKEGKEDRRKGNVSRNVTVFKLTVTPAPKSGEVDCAQGVTFTATLVGRGTGTVQFHWERTSGKVPGSIEFTDADALQAKNVTDQAAVPAGAASATITQKMVIDNGPSKGKSATATANVTCKK